MSARDAITREDAERCDSRFSFNRERRCQLDAGHNGRCAHDDLRGCEATWAKALPTRFDGLNAPGLR